MLSIIFRELWFDTRFKSQFEQLIKKWSHSSYVCIVLVGFRRVFYKSSKSEVPTQCNDDQNVAKSVSTKTSDNGCAQPPCKAVSNADSY